MPPRPQDVYKRAYNAKRGLYGLGAAWRRSRGKRSCRLWTRLRSASSSNFDNATAGTSLDRADLRNAAGQTIITLRRLSEAELQEIGGAE